MTGPVFLSQVLGLIAAPQRADGGLLSRHERRPRRGLVAPILPGRLLQGRPEGILLSVRLVAVVVISKIAVAADERIGAKSDVTTGVTSDVKMSDAAQIDVERSAEVTDGATTVAMLHVMTAVTPDAETIAVVTEDATKWEVIVAIDAEDMAPAHCGALLSSRSLVQTGLATSCMRCALVQ